MKPHLLNQLATNEENISPTSSAPSDSLSGPFFQTTERSGNPYVIPLIAKNISRQNNSPASGWSSSGYWTTFYTYYSGTNDAIQRYGYARPHGANKDQYSTNSYGPGGSHKMLFAKGKSVGMSGPHSPGGGTGTSYCDFFSGLMYIKNPTSSTQTVNLYHHYANYWSSGHDGSSCTVYLPNASTKAATTSVSIQQVWSRTSSSSMYDSSGSFSLPAGRTAAVVCQNTCQYHTSYSSGLHYTGHQYWNNLDTTFSTCIPDYNMYAMAMMATSQQVTTSYFTSTSHIGADWKRCHDIFGD